MDINSSPFSQLWRAVVKTPSGMPVTVEVRAPSQQIALDKIAYWKPDAEVATDPYGNPLIERRPTA